MPRKVLPAIFILLFFINLNAYAKPLINNGDKVLSDQQFPFVVAIYEKNDPTSNCTGTLIAPRWVLTANHCVWEILKPSDLTIGFGNKANFRPQANKVMAVKEIYQPDADPETLHKFYGRLKQDFTLLELEEAATATPVALPENAQAFPEFKSGKQHATLVGYGWYDISWPAICDKDSLARECYEDLKYDEYLRYGEEIIQPDDVTQNLVAQYRTLDNADPNDEYPVYNTATMLGAVPAKDQRAGSGDSGGPLLIKQTASDGTVSYIQVGVGSWGLPNTYNGYKAGYFSKEPAVYASLLNEEALAFIRNTMHDHP